MRSRTITAVLFCLALCSIGSVVFVAEATASASTNLIWASPQVQQPAVTPRSGTLPTPTSPPTPTPGPTTAPTATLDPSTLVRVRGRVLVTNGLSFDPLADIRVELWASDSPDDVGRFVRTSFSVADGFFYFPPTVYFGQGYLHLLVNPTPAHIPRSAMSGSGVVVSPNHIRLVPSPGADFGDNTFVVTVHSPPANQLILKQQVAELEGERYPCDVQQSPLRCTAKVKHRVDDMYL